VTMAVTRSQRHLYTTCRDERLVKRQASLALGNNS